MKRIKMVKNSLMCCALAITMTVMMLFTGTPLRAQAFRVGPVVAINCNFPSEYDPGVGFHAGVQAEFDFRKSLDGAFINMKVLFALKSWREDRSILGWYGLPRYVRQTDFHVTASPCYLVVPLHGGYRFALGRKVGLAVSGGPYIAYGLFGSAYEYVPDMGGVNSFGVRVGEHHERIDIFDDKYKETQRMYWGFGLQVSVDLCKHYQIALGYNHDLQKKVRFCPQNHDLSLGFSYLF